ncbi:hypothetical protein AB0J72_31395 [Dactylosporangium sp. NPDC049742]|uniref:hypothetical protein n=1 Tax=Dactylosporangium sp. NPDC049742 TaxID=3154737 RepID=UPI00342EBEE1
MTGPATHRDPRALAGAGPAVVDPRPPAVLAVPAARVRVTPGGSRRIPLPLAVPAPPPQPRPVVFEPAGVVPVTRTAVFPPPAAFPAAPAPAERVVVFPAPAAPPPSPAAAAPPVPPPDLDALAARLLDPLLRSITARQRAERDRRDGHGRR